MELNNSETSLKVLYKDQSVRCNAIDITGYIIEKKNNFKHLSDHQIHY